MREAQIIEALNTIRNVLHMLSDITTRHTREIDALERRLMDRGSESYTDVPSMTITQPNTGPRRPAGKPKPRGRPWC